MNNTLAIITFLGKRLAAYLLAVAATYLLASITATQAVVSSLAGMGVKVDFSSRVDMTLQDLGGMAGMFLPMVAFALLAAFLVTALLYRWLRKWRTPLYILAGAAGLVTIHLALNLAFGITPVAIARSAGGLTLQAIAGAAGGYTYISLLKKGF